MLHLQLGVEHCCLSLNYYQRERQQRCWLLRKFQLAGMQPSVSFDICLGVFVGSVGTVFFLEDALAGAGEASGSSVLEKFLLEVRESSATSARGTQYRDVLPL